MTDWNKEAELLGEWLKYRIDWFTNYPLYGRITLIPFDFSGSMSTEEVLKVFSEQGVSDCG